MAKRSPRLIFTEEERALPELERAVRKADRAADKLEKAEAKIPKKTVKVKKRVVDSESGKVTTRLFFEEADKKRPPSRLAHAARKAPLDTVRSAVHRKLREEGDDNPGTEAANTLTETAERTWRIAESAHRSHAEKPYRKADKAEAAADKANLKALNKQYEQEYGRASNPYSRWQQKRAIKKEYAAAKAGNGARNTVKASETTAKAAKRAAEGSKKAGSFFVRHKKGFLIAGGVAAAILLLMICISSCSTLFQGGASGIAASTYPLEDADMLAAEAAYCAMEDELREYLNSYESTHDYDEYHFDLDEIEHDPYVLISMITALKGGEWTIDEIGGILETLFEKQYILTETVATETRYRTETHIGYYTDENGNLIDPDTGEIVSPPEETEPGTETPSETPSEPTPETPATPETPGTGTETTDPSGSTGGETGTGSPETPDQPEDPGIIVVPPEEPATPDANQGLDPVTGEPLPMGG